ncbi:HTH CENPB-type domain-containing protein [Trichonephila clavipes]|nr:HTH CENPB-type domain-containing protein [Trichonephila clavipes]
MGPGKRSKHSAGFKIKVIQFAKENGNRAAARISHLTDNTKKLLTECNTDTVVIPGGLTSLVQPLDVCINKPFKQNLKREWNMWMLEGEKSFTKGGQMRHASLEIVYDWIIKPWNEIKPDLIQKSFKNVVYLTV